MDSSYIPKVAVLMATYNGERWVEEQLESIRNQKDVNITIFISDDLSTDNTLSICNKYKNIHPAIINILPSNQKFGGAGRNFYRLIEDVDFELFDYVCFSDQDDIWNADKIKNAISHLQLNKSSCYSSNVTAFYPTGLKKIVDKAQPQTKFDYLFEAAGPGCTYVLETNTLLDFKSFFSKNKKDAYDVCLHDWFLYAFARANNYAWYIDKNPSMMYRQHGNNQVGANITIKAKFKRLALVRNKWYRSEVTKITNLLISDGFVKKQLSTGYRGNLMMALRFWQLRRKLTDKIFILLMLVFNFF